MLFFMIFIIGAIILIVYSISIWAIQMNEEDEQNEEDHNRH